MGGATATKSSPQEFCHCIAGAIAEESLVTNTARSAAVGEATTTTTGSVVQQNQNNNNLAAGSNEDMVSKGESYLPEY